MGQKKIQSKLRRSINTYETYGLKNREDFLDLMFSMLEWDPMKRISPDDILKHAFLN